MEKQRGACRCDPVIDRQVSVRIGNANSASTRSQSEHVRRNSQKSSSPSAHPLYGSLPDGAAVIVEYAHPWALTHSSPVTGLPHVLVVDGLGMNCKWPQRACVAESPRIHHRKLPTTWL